MASWPSSSSDSSGRRMNSHRRRPGPPDTAVVGRFGSQIWRLIGSNTRGSSRIDVDDQPVVEEPSVVDADVEQLAHGRVRTVAADDVPGSDRVAGAAADGDEVVVAARARRPRRRDGSRASAAIVRAPRAAASSSGWQNIDENGQPDAPVPMRPKRSSVVPAALRHSYTSAGSDRARSSSPMPQDWRRRPTSSSKCTARGSGYGAGHCSRTTTDRPSWASSTASTSPDGPGADDRDVAVDVVDGRATPPALMAAAAAGDPRR